MENVARRMSTPSFTIDKIEENLDKEIKEELENEDEQGLMKMWVDRGAWGVSLLNIKHQFLTSMSSKCFVKSTINDLINKWI